MADITTDMERITLGSGKLYYQEFSGGTLPVDSAIEADGNLFGKIKGGAELAYKPEYFEDEDDLGTIKKTIITSEKATLKSGIMTWAAGKLKQLCSTARVTTDTSKKSVSVKIGGIGNYDGKNYLFRFVHVDINDGFKVTCRVTVVGKNQAGFTLNFAKDKSTVVDAEITAVPMDSEGTLILYTETTEAITAPSA